ncbi:hypothetical protein [Inediibacterium massiliense]|uniref:hypothetical protein n=1 Tax=Inediibacterium massiliense TaxID=1658111 RepID=UPI0006B56FDF|nr:hypothetical protein [Inediibacterium massiliense]
MPFSNQKNILMHDEVGNLHSFQEEKEKIIYTYFDKQLGEYKKEVLIENSSGEFDASMDEKDLYMVYQNTKGEIILMTFKKGIWYENSLGGDVSLKVFNLNIVLCTGKVHIVYCVKAQENSMCYRIYHHYCENQEWRSFVVEDIEIQKFLNPFQLIDYENKLVIGFYQLIKGYEQIFIKEFDIQKQQWNPSIQLTWSSCEKLYLNLLMTHEELIHVTYSSYVDGNLIIKYEKYKLEQDQAIKKIEHILSNPANCSYPLFVKEKDKLWTIWTEYDQVVSSFSIDEGITWSEPYLWKESKEILFFQYKYYTNYEKIKENYQLCYAFGKAYPEFSFIGFGPLEKAQEIPIKKKRRYR